MRILDNIKLNEIRAKAHWWPVWKRGITPGILSTIQLCSNLNLVPRIWSTYALSNIGPSLSTVPLFQNQHKQ